MPVYSGIHQRLGSALVPLSCLALLAACGSSGNTGAAAGQAKTSSGASSPNTASGTPTHSVSSLPVPTVAASSTAAPTANFNSCTVVTQAEAESAIGQSVAPGVLGHATVEGGLACVFYGPAAPTPRTPDVAQPDSVRVVVVKGADALKWFNDYKSKVAAQPISGYGDQAYYDGRASLSVLKGDSYLRVAVSPPGAPPSLSDEKQIATAILAKL